MAPNLREILNRIAKCLQGCGRGWLQAMHHASQREVVIFSIFPCALATTRTMREIDFPFGAAADPW